MNTESTQKAENVGHVPLELTSVEGMPMVRCSCDADDPRRVRWQSAYWLREHWQGTQEEGVAAIRAVIARQAAEHHSRPAARCEACVAEAFAITSANDPHTCDLRTPPVKSSDGGPA